MWSLRIVEEEAALPERSETTWYHLDQRVCAHVYSINGGQCLHFPRIAKYFLNPNSSDIKAIPEDSAPITLVEDTFQRLVLPMQFQLRGTEVLHASAVLIHGKVVAICANSGMGKSTTAFALSLRGHLPFADDVVPFRFKSDHVEAVNLPFRVRLRTDAANHLDPVNADQYSKTSHDIPSQGRKHPAPLVAIVILKRDSSLQSNAPVIRRLQAQESFVEILKHAWCFSLNYEERRALMMKQYLDLVARIPIHEICYDANLTEIDSLLNIVEALVPSHS